MKKYYKEIEVAAPLQVKPSPGNCVGSSWSVMESGGKFFLEYISGQLGGALKSLEITEEEYELARSGSMDANTLCLKYNVT